MKKDNPMLKKALEEAARQELKSLPEEKQIIRPYSDKFEKDMQTLLGNKDSAVIRKSPRVKVAALIVAVLVVVLTAGVVSATDGFKIFSPEWREMYIESMQTAKENAAKTDGVEEFEKELAQADKPLVNLGIDDEYASTDILFDYDSVYDINVTAEKDGYLFKVDKIIKGRYIRNKVISGNPIKGTAVYEKIVDEDYFLVTEISRTDGKKLTKAFYESVVIADYNPFRTQSITHSGPFLSEQDEYRLIDVSKIDDEAIPFANHDFAWVITDHDNDDMGGLLDYYNYYIDEDGLPAFREEPEGTNIIIKFNIDPSLADEKVAKAYAEENNWNVGLQYWEK